MKKIIISIIALSFILNSCVNESAEEKLNRIHAKAITIDTHTDTPLWFTRENFDFGKDYDSRKDGNKYYLPGMEKGELDAAFFAVFLGQGDRDDESIDKVRLRTENIFTSLKSQIEKYKDRAEIALNSDDVYRLEKEGKRAIYIGLENGYPIGKDMNYLTAYYNMGARYVTLCHTRNNDICDSSNDEEEHGGLSEFGKSIIPEMNKIGMMIDVSHISDKSFYDVVELSKTPVIASHSNARTICDNPRNMTDDMLLKLKENGGVIQLCLLSDYVKKMPSSPERDSAFTALREKYQGFDRKKITEEEYKQGVQEWYAMNRLFPQNLATVQDLVDHLDHIVNLIGVDYVGIGSDFDGGGGLEDCYDVTEFKNITKELLARGYTENEIYKIWGANFLRVFKAVEDYAKKNQS